MAQLNKAKRRLARQKRELSLYRQREALRSENDAMRGWLKQTGAKAQYSTLTLMAILAQKGGEIEITKGTYQQVIENAQRLSWAIEPRDEAENTLIVRLVETSNDMAEAQNGEAESPQPPVKPEPGDVERLHDDGNPNHEE